MKCPHCGVEIEIPLIMASELKYPKKKEKSEDLARLEESFARFWQKYPRRVGRKPAFKIWCKINPDDEIFKQIMGGIEHYKASDQWKRDNGMYIPHPTTFLNQARWEDELPKKEKSWIEF